MMIVCYVVWIEIWDEEVEIEFLFLVKIFYGSGLKFKYVLE